MSYIFLIYALIYVGCFVWLIRHYRQVEHLGTLALIVIVLALAYDNFVLFLGHLIAPGGALRGARALAIRPPQRAHALAALRGGELPTAGGIPLV